MTDAREADAQARAEIQTRLDETVFVEAGAGTGKTTALVGRIVALVKHGIDLRNIAAITFTEKAAAELKDRVRQKLEEEARNGTSRSEAERERCQAAIDHIDGAALQTLHSFAQRILAQHPIEAGLPPWLTLRDEIEADLAFDERWDRFLDVLLGSETSDLPLERALQLGLEAPKLKDVAKAFHYHWDRLRGAHVRFAATDAQPRVDVSTILAALDEAVTALDICPGCDDKLEAHLREVITPYIARMRAASDDEQRLAVLMEGPKLTSSKGDGPHWTGPSKAEVHDALRAAQVARDSLIQDLRAACIGPIFEALRDFVLQYAGERRASGELEFNDLLVLARDLLRDNETVRTRLHERYARLLIDEFQDTDPVQIELATLLATVAPPNGDGWDELKVPDGRLFFVGDPKQSIYRFRSADIELYQRAQLRFGQHPRRLTLNFRSGPGIIDWVNEMFEALFAPVPGGSAEQVEYIALTAGAGTDDLPGEPIRLLGGVHDADGQKVGATRRIEAAEIARAIRTIRYEQWLVRDQHANNARRPARFADITVLLPTRTSLAVLERALEDAGVPFRVESQSLLYATQEVRDLTSVLAAIDDPTDEVAVVAALRSPAFACSDRALAEWAGAEGKWDYQRRLPALPDDHPVMESMAALRVLHDARWFESVSSIVERVIHERRLFEVAFARRRPREMWQRLRFVQERARAFVDSGGTTLRQFVTWLRAQAESGSRVVESVVPESDDDAVRIMTIHAAKGLEFPIVILAGLNTKPQNSASAVIWDKDGVPQVRVGVKDAYFDTPGYAAAKVRELAMDRLEKDRLLYVAATRARDHLVVSLHHKAKTQCHAARLHQLCADTERWVPLQFEQAEPGALRAAPLFDDSPAGREMWLHEREERLQSTRRAPVFAATTIARDAREAAVLESEKAEPVDDEAPWRRGRAGTSIGRAVHAVLQSIDLARPGDSLAETARAQAVAEGIAGSDEEIGLLVRAALGSHAVQAALASGKYWREVFVASPIGEATIEGFIDLLYEGPDGLVVVDYKTDALRTDEERDTALAKYRLQGAAYAAAVQAALQRDVARCTFVFVTKAGPFERDIEDLPAAIREVREFVSRR